MTFAKFPHRQCPKPGCISVFKTEKELQEHTVCKKLDSIPESDLKGQERIKRQARTNGSFPCLYHTGPLKSFEHDI